MTKQIIIIRKDLKMKPGKMAAQVAHASMAAILNHGFYSETDDSLKFNLNIKGFPNDHIDADAIKDWLTGSFTKICLYVEDEQQLIDIHQKAIEANLLTSMIIDNGLTAFNHVKTKTCVALGPASAERLAPLTSNLKLV